MGPLEVLKPRPRSKITLSATVVLEGNRERLAFLYDSRKVHFAGLASQIFIPPIKKEGGKTLEPTKQLARTPFATRFQIDWCKFRICTTHLLYGGTYVARS